MDAYRYTIEQQPDGTYAIYDQTDGHFEDEGLTREEALAAAAEFEADDGYCDDDDFDDAFGIPTQAELLRSYHGRVL